jgi:alanine racemase
MNKGTKPASVMRSALLSTDALAANLKTLASKHGVDSILDLRANAYGLGAETVAGLAKDLGFTVADYGLSPQGTLALRHQPGSDPVGGWWCGPHGPVMSFLADVISIKRVPAGQGVSYGYHYTTPNETYLALVSAGYADGVPRSASGQAHVLLDNLLLPVAGRIAMDQMVIDAGDAELTVGQACTIWGSQPSIEQWASWAERPVTALLSHIGHRVVKQWI